MSNQDASQKGPDSRIYSHDRWKDLLAKSFAQIEKLATLKGGEYSGDSDRLANFRRNAFDCGLDYRQIWRVYAGKHWDAVGQYVKDLASQKDRVRLESIEGRINDLLVYLLLFKAMLEEAAPQAASSKGIYEGISISGGVPETKFLVREHTLKMENNK